MSTTAGFVYAIRFSSGTVKVGQSKDAGRRIKEHAKNASCHGVQITDQWTSYLESYENVEGRLLILAREMGGVSIPSNPEYFTGLDYKRFVKRAGRDWGTFESFSDYVEREAEHKRIVAEYIAETEPFDEFAQSPQSRGRRRS